MQHKLLHTASYPNGFKNLGSMRGLEPLTSPRLILASFLFSLSLQMSNPVFNLPLLAAEEKAQVRATSHFGMQHVSVTVD